MQATAKIFFQTSPAQRNKDGLCPVRLKITHKGKRKYYSITDKLKNDEWAFLDDDQVKQYKRYVSNGGRSKIRDVHDEYKRIQDEANSIIESLQQFSFNQFEEVFNHNVTKWDNVFEALLSHIQDLKEQNRYGYSSSFESTLRAVKEFTEKKKFKFNDRKDKVETRTDFYLGGRRLLFIDVTPTWLKKFEAWMVNDGKSKSTIGIYMRNLRVIFNLVIKEHGVKAEYPFIKHKPKTSSGNKRALPASDISKIATFETKHPQKAFYRDIFMFSFLGNGMNTADIARLRYSNIHDDELEFVRQKTKAKDEEEVLRVPITESMSSIIERHGNKSIGYDSYIFPVLKPAMTEREIYYAVKQFTKQLNKYIGQIAEELHLGHLTSYSARHSWATIAKNSGTSTEFIKEALGHSSVAVTERYLKSFEKSTRQKHSQEMEKAVYNNQTA
nr:tyrosine-type recombinase/integrase [uncultured Draconibacterium sp.]